MIQVNLQTKKQSTSMDIVDLVEDELTNAYKPTERDAHFYRTLEETVEGQCETLYTVVKPNMYKSQRQEVFNVTKTVNFEKCLKRPQIKYNFYFGTPCPTSHQEYQEDQKFLKSSSISQYQVIKTSKMHIVKNSHTESEYVFTPLNEEANTIVTYVR
uniref:Vitellogenin domain-containing protein n=1 Tax=Romanomermis culicivorax TaxID=13658 RepID=A0A915JMC0_ROMCU